MTIEELIANGQRKLEEQAAANAKAQAEESARKAIVRQIAVDQFNNDVRACTPVYLWSYIVIAEQESNPFWEPRYEDNVTIRVPQCSGIVFAMRHNYNPDKENGRKCDYTWHRPGKEPKYWVQHAKELYMDYEFEQWVARHETLETSDIEIALAWARNEFQIEQEFLAEAEKRNAKLAADMRERRETDAAKTEQSNIAANRAYDQRHALVDEVARDPVAFRLIQVMAEITKVRDAWQEQLDQAGERLNEINEAHESATQRMTERANEQVRRAGHEAEAARRREQDARDEAEDAARKLKQAQRGW